MYDVDHKVRFSVTLLIPVVLMLVLGTASSTEAVRIKSKPIYKVSNEFNPLWSFQGAIDERIDDGDDEYHGIQLSISRFLSGSNAVRFNLGIAEDGYRRSRDRIFHSAGAVYEFDDIDNFDATGVTLSIQGLFYSTPKREPRLYWGLGPRLGIRDASPTVLVTYNSGTYDEWSEYLEYDNGTLISFGLEGSIGFEWFLGRNLSMAAEYGIAVQNEWYLLDYEYYDQYGHRITEVDSFDDGIHIDASHIKLGLSVYF